jgi:ribosomal protein S18 acetylase RimI-like enzyme
VTSFTVRDAVESDMSGCVALARRALPERDAGDWRDALRGDLGSPERHLSVAEMGNTIIGYGRAELFVPAADAPPGTAPRGYYLVGMYVHPGHRRHGAGTALTRSRLAWIAEHDREAWYFANARNAATVELHRRLGFREATRSFSFPGVTFDGGEGILFRAELRDGNVLPSR